MIKSTKPVRVAYDDSNKAMYVYAAFRVDVEGKELPDMAFPTFGQAQLHYRCKDWRELDRYWEGDVSDRTFPLIHVYPLFLSTISKEEIKLMEEAGG